MAVVEKPSKINKIAIEFFEDNFINIVNTPHIIPLWVFEITLDTHNIKICMIVNSLTVIREDEETV